MFCDAAAALKELPGAAALGPFAAELVAEAEPVADTLAEDALACALEEAAEEAAVVADGSSGVRPPRFWLRIYLSG